MRPPQAAKQANGWRAVVLLIAAVGLAMFAWPKLTGIKAQNLEQQWAIDWINENEGDPRSVELIELLGPHMGVVYAKYRCTGPLGGPIVQDRCFRVRDDGIEYSAYSTYTGPEQPQRANPLGKVIENLLGK